MIHSCCVTSRPHISNNIVVVSFCACRFKMIEVMTQLPPPLISIDCNQLMYQDDPMLTCLNDVAAAAGSLSSATACWNNTSTWDRFTPSTASSDEWLSDLYNYNPSCTSFTSSPGLPFIQSFGIFHSMSVDFDQISRFLICFMFVLFL